MQKTHEKIIQILNKSTINSTLSYSLHPSKLSGSTDPTPEIKDGPWRPQPP